jgi:hypothetical protein
LPEVNSVLTTSNAPRTRATAQPVSVSVRRFPFPYRAALAICSDLDETPSLETYLEQLRFLNTTSETAIGSGVGLEVGNSLYFDMAPGHFSYWNTSEHGRECLSTLIRSGHVDCLHSFGDLANTRSHAERAWNELDQHRCQFKVWVDHAVAPTNFGSDIMCGHGDEPNHAAYHADLTLAHGIRYLWRGRVTSVIGQDQPASLRANFRAEHALASARTIAKEFAKRSLARAGSRKYALHSANALLQPIQLRDGQRAWEFLRCNPHWGGVSAGDTGTGIAEVLQPVFLDSLTKREGACVLYTHLGKLGGEKDAFGSATVAAFRRLAEYARSKKIFVTTTRRLLDYTHTRESVQITAEVRGDELAIDLRRAAADETRLDGLTIYTDARLPIALSINGERIDDVTNNPPDHTGRTSVSLPWPSLNFPALA